MTCQVHRTGGTDLVHLLGYTTPEGRTSVPRDGGYDICRPQTGVDVGPLRTSPAVDEERKLKVSCRTVSTHRQVSTATTTVDSTERRHLPVSRLQTDLLSLEWSRVRDFPTPCPAFQPSDKRPEPRLPTHTPAREGENPNPVALSVRQIPRDDTL